MNVVEFEDNLPDSLSIRSSKKSFADYKSPKIYQLLYKTGIIKNSTQATLVLITLVFVITSSGSFIIGHYIFGIGKESPDEKLQKMVNSLPPAYQKNLPEGIREPYERMSKK